MESIFHKVDCLHCRLSELCLPHGLTQEEVSQLETIVKRKLPIKLDEYLYRQEDQAQSVFTVKSGSFRSFILGKDGTEQTIGFYLPGELMGLDALQNGYFRCSVVALETATVCELPLPRLNELCSKMPSLQAQLMRIIGKEIVSDHDKIVLLGNRSAREKMATFLLMLSRRYSALGFSSTEFNLSMRRHDIANFLGLTIETVSRQLTELSNSGIITVKQRGVQINKLDSLKAIVEPCLPNHFSFTN
ncbi:fumarate/nitrate reduction transcriptional regulator Fnr [Methyloglobulus sp.]|uniref:fumarate/nitrate reduction transcriptional regulator Fnr n=1 Tax=Methyloglobulus sp. TaxID=2518622 RepID=UPI0032B80F00